MIDLGIVRRLEESFFIVLIRVLITKFALNNLQNLQIKLLSSYQNMNYSDFTKRNHSEYIRNIRELSAACMSCLEDGLKISSEIITILAIVIFLILGAVLNPHDPFSQVLIVVPLVLLYEF